MLEPRARIQGLGVLVCFVLMSLIEVTGVVSVFPFILLVAKPAAIAEQPILTGVYNALGFQSEKAFIVFAGIGVLIILAVGNAFSAFTTLASLRYVSKLQAEFSRGLIRRYMSRPYAWFLRQNTSELGRNILVEAMTVPVCVYLPVLRIVSRSLVAILLLIGLVYMSPIIAFSTFFILGGAYGWLYYMSRARLVQLGKERIEADAARYKLATEALNGIKSTIILGKESFFAENFAVQSARATEIMTSQNLWNELPRFFLETLVFGGIISIILMLVIKEGDITAILPTISLYTLAAYRLMPALQQIFGYAAQIRANLPDFRHLRDEFFADIEESRDIDQPPRPPLPLNAKLALDNVSFTYPGTSEPVLNGIQLEIEKNTSVGFVGSTGAGKTTLIDIVLGLLTPNRGNLSVDGLALRSREEIARWQRNIGYVPQEIYLTDSSLRANIAYGVPEDQIDNIAVDKAIKLASLDQFVDQLPEGLDTTVGERGVRLSGGQRQRIGIARALYHDPAVLVMDEATSSLDGVTESAVMEAVQTLSRQKTTILVAHRFSTVQACDVIYYLARGCVVAKGDFSSLMNTNEEFKTMAMASSMDPSPVA